MAGNEDDQTPAHRGPAYSAEALNLLDLALALAGTASLLRQAARRLDESEAGDRHQLSVALEFQLAEIRDSCDAAAAALRNSR